MNCGEFEDRWNEVLDARLPGRPALDSVLEAHASACERCRNIATGYQVLHQAVAAWPTPPPASARSLERLAALRVPPAPPVRLHRTPRRFVWFPLASAAAVFGLVWLGGQSRDPDRPPVPAPAPKPRVVATPPLNAALAEATEATIGLAREASAPATRIGREVIEYQEAEASTIASRSDAAEEVASTASEVLQTVGEQVNAGVRPISGSAWHAFTFLLGPAPDHPQAVPPATHKSL